MTSKNWAIKTLLVCFVMSVVVSGQRRNKIPRRQEKERCKILLRGNAGVLNFQNNKCEDILYKWVVRPSHSLNITLENSVILRDEFILVASKDKHYEDFKLLRLVGNETAAHLVIRPPTRFVAIKVPKSATLGGSYQFYHDLHGDGGLDECVTDDETVTKQCNRRSCMFLCKSPNFVTKRARHQFVQCGARKWRKKLKKLCIPRERVFDICPNNTSCRYTIVELLQFFEYEESKIGTDIPPMQIVPTSVQVKQGRLSRVRQPSNSNWSLFIYYLCKTSDDGAFQFKCASFPKNYIFDCLVQRFHFFKCIQGVRPVE